MFPSFFTRLADAALEVADAMLAPLPADLVDGLCDEFALPDGVVSDALADPSSPRAALPADHPHRQLARSGRAGIVARRAAGGQRRPGSLSRAPQPCASPLSPSRAARSSRLETASATQRAPAA